MKFQRNFQSSLSVRFQVVLLGLFLASVFVVVPSWAYKTDKDVILGAMNHTTGVIYSLSGSLAYLSDGTKVNVDIPFDSVRVDSIVLNPAKVQISLLSGSNVIAKETYEFRNLSSLDTITEIIAADLNFVNCDDHGKTIELDSEGRFFHMRIVSKSFFMNPDKDISLYFDSPKSFNRKKN